MTQKRRPFRFVDAFFLNVCMDRKGPSRSDELYSAIAIPVGLVAHPVYFTPVIRDHAFDQACKHPARLFASRAKKSTARQGKTFRN